MILTMKDFKMIAMLVCFVISKLIYLLSSSFPPYNNTHIYLPVSVRERALVAYKRELSCPANLDLGLHGVTRANLRVLCRTAVLESSTQMRKRYSHSNMSSMGSIHDE